MLNSSEFQLVAAAWLAKFGTPIPITGAIDLALEILREDSELVPSLDLQSNCTQSAVAASSSRI